MKQTQLCGLSWFHHGHDERRQVRVQKVEEWTNGPGDAAAAGDGPEAPTALEVGGTVASAVLIATGAGVTAAGAIMWAGRC